jgi:hypothetical protein
MADELDELKERLAAVEGGASNAMPQQQMGAPMGGYSVPGTFAPQTPSAPKSPKSKFGIAMLVLIGLYVVGQFLNYALMLILYEEAYGGGFIAFRQMILGTCSSILLPTGIAGLLFHLNKKNNEDEGEPGF